ncbi:hypothetical protein An06g00180 [Aspergillus niger]|uniref:Uncharacterized protein n=2 Tax=Aspergillus niger TaxID=5061 RepID=A2QL73_ASPNC|nr:hypothetical protein An06g00180 [Aspergillus niger]CAK44934.1 hypothetical protein An06g00180 [Aspergillus niger]
MVSFKALVLTMIPAVMAQNKTLIGTTSEFRVCTVDARPIYSDTFPTISITEPDLTQDEQINPVQRCCRLSPIWLTDYSSVETPHAPEATTRWDTGATAIRIAGSFRTLGTMGGRDLSEESVDGLINAT